MAKGKKMELVDENTNSEAVNAEGAEGTSTETVEAAPAAPRGIILTLEDGTTVPRAQFIRKRFTEDKISRGAIAKELTKLQGKEVPYQIVFAATKGLKGGPDKVEATETVAAEGSAA